MAQNTPGPPAQDMGLFDTFNTHDVSTAPTSEREDPLTLDDIGDFLNNEVNIKEELPIGSMNENTDMGDLVDQVIVPQVMNMKTENEDIIEEVLQLDSDGAPIFQANQVEQAEQPNAGALRIRSFAMDPDSLCVLPSNPPSSSVNQMTESSSGSNDIQSSSEHVLVNHDYAAPDNNSGLWQSSNIQPNYPTSDVNISTMPAPNVMVAQSEFYPGDLDRDGVELINPPANNQFNANAGTALSFPYISMQVFFWHITCLSISKKQNGLLFVPTEHL